MLGDDYVERKGCCMAHVGLKEQKVWGGTFVLLLLALVLLTSCGFGPSPQDQAAAQLGKQLLAKAKHAFDTAKTFHEKFNITQTGPYSQQTATVEVQSQQTLREQLSVFQSSMPVFTAGSVTVEDGKYLWQYYPDHKIVHRSSAAPEGVNGNVTPLYLYKFVFTAPDATVTSSSATINGHAVYDVHLVSGSVDGGLPYTGEIYIDKKTTLPVRIQFSESTGQAVVDIPLLVLNEPIPAHTFTFTPPADAKVLTTGSLPLAQAEQEADYHLLTIPTTQKGYRIENVNAVGQAEEIAYNLNYSKGSTNFNISEGKFSPNQPTSGTPITVRGKPGTVVATSGVTVLTWAEHGVRISIEGMLSKVQAMSVAQVLA